MVRDPKDVFVSSYHFVKAMALGKLMPTRKQWLDLFLSPYTPAGSWASHLDGGWRNRDRDNVLFLTYEEMKADLPVAVTGIAALMGVALTPQEFAGVVEQSSYAHMKAIGHKFDTPGLPWGRSEVPWSGPRRRERCRRNAGRTAKRRVDDYWRAELQRLGSDFPYDEMFATT